MHGTIRGRDLLQPRSLTDALKMLRNEGPLVPLAGCTAGNRLTGINSAAPAMACTPA